MKNSIELIFANRYKRCYYLILVGFIVDYKEQILIIGIKVNMQYLICHISLKKRVNNLIIEALKLLVYLKLT